MRQQLNTSTGPMADIAFLLLIFFLVTSNISQDYGITVNISKPFDMPDSISTAHTTLLVNSNGQYLLNDQKVSFNELSEKMAKSFTTSKATKNIVLLKSSRDVDFGYYIQALNESKKSIKVHYEGLAQRIFNKEYVVLADSQKLMLRNAYPVALAEDVVNF